MSDHTPDATSDAVPDATPDDTPEAGPDAASVATWDAASVGSPEGTTGAGSRAARRAARDAMPAPQPIAVQPIATLASVALAALVALSGYAGVPLVALSVAFGGAVLAWGWPGMLGLPSPRGSTFVLAVAVVATTIAAAVSTRDPFLRWVSGAVAGSVIVAFLHQLGRRDGRPRLVESVASTVTGVGVLACGVCLVPLPRLLYGESVLAMAMASLSIAALVDLLGRWPGVRAWLLPAGALLGAGAATLVGGSAPGVSALEAAALGVVAALVSQTVRRLFSLLPTITAPRSQLTSGSASVLTCGVAIYVVGRLVLA